MRDAVAEILLERRALVPRRSPSLVVSLLFHLLIAGIMVMSGRRDSFRPASNVLNIRLAPPPVVAASPQPVVQTPPAAAPAPQPPVEQPKPQKTPPRRAVDKALFGKSTEKATPKTPVAAPAPPSGASVKRDPGPAAGIVGLEGGDFPYTIYIDRMLALIGTHWLRPQTQREVLTQVYFVIERDGRVRDVKIEKESGLPSFDRAAYRAVLEASPLPPLPFGYSGTFLGVHLTFH